MADEDAQATMKDLKEVQASLMSLMDSCMDELRELIAKLASAKATRPRLVLTVATPHRSMSTLRTKVRTVVMKGIRRVIKRTTLLRNNPPLKEKVARRNSMLFLLPTLPTH